VFKAHRMEFHSAALAAGDLHALDAVIARHAWHF
jgi:hypothetical protein